MFSHCFHSGDSSTKPRPGLLADLGSCKRVGCVHVLVESANKRLRAWVLLAGNEEENCVLVCCSWEMQTATISSSLCCLLMVHATCHVFLLTQSPLFAIYYNLPSIRTLSLFLFPLPLHWTAFSLPMQAGGNGLPAACLDYMEEYSAQHQVSGVEMEQRHHCLNPSSASGCSRRVSTVARGEVEG